jgi:hypothetical protein
MCSLTADPTYCRGVLGGKIREIRVRGIDFHSPNVITTNIMIASTSSVCQNNKEALFAQYGVIMNIAHYVENLHSYVKMSAGVIIDRLMIAKMTILRLEVDKT